MTTAPEEAPRCECHFDSKTRRWRVRYFNCSDENAENRARAHRIEQITRQLSGRSGLTNRERRELHRERNFLQRTFMQTQSQPGPNTDRRMKATEKKLRWLAKKKVAQANLQET
jgi:hypothetical protein